MNEENLARQAELALDRQGDYDSLFYEGQWHSSGSLADRAGINERVPQFVLAGQEDQRGHHRPGPPRRAIGD